MKMLTTLAAVAALLAGISLASAQMTPSPSQSSPPKATGDAAFCIGTSASSSLNCKYTSMAACEKDAKPQKLNCMPNPNKSTTGSKQ